MIEAAFIFTAAMLVMALFRLIPLMWGKGVSLPHLIPGTSITPDTWIVMYPSAMFQIWFWTDKLGVFA